jgi:hypothetical protein
LPTFGSSFSYCERTLDPVHDDGHLGLGEVACKAAPDCCEWVVPDAAKNAPNGVQGTAQQYCNLLNEDMVGQDNEGAAKICTATTCCQMITELNNDGVQQTVCRRHTNLAANAVCEGSCKAPLPTQQCMRGASTYAAVTNVATMSQATVACASVANNGCNAFNWDVAGSKVWLKHCWDVNAPTMTDAYEGDPYVVKRSGLDRKLKQVRACPCDPHRCTHATQTMQSAPVQPCSSCTAALRCFVRWLSQGGGRFSQTTISAAACGGATNCLIHAKSAQVDNTCQLQTFSAEAGWGACTAVTGSSVAGWFAGTTRFVFDRAPGYCIASYRTSSSSSYRIASHDLARRV